MWATEEVPVTIACTMRSSNVRPHSRGAINRRLGRDLSRKEVDNHFVIKVTDEIRWSTHLKQTHADAQLDGIDIIRTSLDASEIWLVEAVRAPKSQKPGRQKETVSFLPLDGQERRRGAT